MRFFKRSATDQTIPLYTAASALTAFILITFHSQQQSWWFSTTGAIVADHPFGWWGATVAGALYMLFGKATLLIPLIIWLHRYPLLHRSYTALYSTIALINWCSILHLSTASTTGALHGGAMGMLCATYLLRAIGNRSATLIISGSIQWGIILHYSDYRELYRQGSALCRSLRRYGATGIHYIIHWWRCMRLLSMQHTRPKEYQAAAYGTRAYQSGADSQVLPSARESISTHSGSEAYSGYQLPNVTLLWKERSAVSPAQRTPHHYRAQATILEEKLAHFGISGSVTSIIVGPVIILFEYQPKSDVPVSKITAREDDLALALQAVSLRIIAPIPGKSVVGFECSRHEREIVFFGDQWQTLFEQQRQLPLLIGVTTQGAPVALDLALLPHLLVAGATGSGKSVMLHNLLISLLITKKPEEVRLILIDPKRLEFAGYTDIPHLLFPIITAPQEAIGALRWAVKEMEQRYELLAQARVTHVNQYRAAGNRLYDIVIIIDEWADLMMSGGKDAELSLVRLTQMARAAGIHLIVATQRPSVDVITGIIKANIPSRIACKVSSKIDSRTIIDTGGAERLLGRGDMLVMISGKAVERMHAAYLSPEEIEQIVCTVRRQGAPSYIDNTTLHKSGLLDIAAEDRELYQQVVAIIKTMDEVSISSLQRRLRIGYNRSARMIDYLEAHGMILPSEGAKARKVLR